MMRRWPILVTFLVAAAEPVKFYFEYAAVAGAADVSQHLVIRGQSATVIHEPGYPSVEGDTIGIFRTSVSREQQEQIAGLVPDHPPSLDVRPDSPAFSIHLQFEKRDVSLVVPNTPAGGTQFGALLAAINQVTAAAMKNPYRAVAFEVAAPASIAAGVPALIRVRLRNPGTQPVKLELNNTVLRVQSTPPPPPPDPNVMPRPVVWNRIDIAPWQVPAVEVAPRESREVAVRVRFPSAGVFLVRAWFSHPASSDPEREEVGGTAISTTARITVSE